ncbi:MAG: VIT domain-containing protein [Phycisphaerae bacterium]
MHARFALLANLLVCVTALGQGLIVTPEPIRDPRFRGGITTLPLEVRYLRVNADIVDGVAHTTVSQSFVNPLNRVIEGTFVFPLPDGAAVGDFSMTMAGQTLTGEVLERDKAREMYERIVRQTRDPALLEFVGNRLYQASMAPIPAGGMVEIKLTYSQTLSETGGVGEFSHPLRVLSQAHAPTAEISINVKLGGQLPLTSVYCPTHACSIQRPSQRDAIATFEQTNARPDRDFQLYYKRENNPLGMLLLTARGAGEPGYFMLRIAPPIETKREQVQPKDIAFVFDTSGSMAGDKIAQARKALQFCIQTLNPEDRFNIYTFSSDVKPFREELIVASSEVKDAAMKFADELRPLGGTNINAALLRAINDDPKDKKRPYMVVFMTDGQPTVEVTVPEAILDNVKGKNSRGIRFHVMGVGSDVNTHLLDKLAELNRGSRDYCVEGENLEIKLSSFVGRIANPVLTDLQLDFGGLKVTDVYPGALPDLFHGGELLVIGRYASEGAFAIRLNGKLRGETQTFTVEGKFPATQRGSDALARLWANRKVAYLLEQVRLHGASGEVKDEIIALAKRFGIVTPYTSSVAVEDGAGQRLVRRMAPGVMPGDKVAGGPRGAGGRGGRAAPAASGPDAVRESKQLKAQAAVGRLSDDDEFEVHANPSTQRRVGEKLFDVVKEQFVDSAWDRKAKPIQIEAFSDAYFALLKEHADAARYLAIGEQVVVVLGEKVYEIVQAKKAAP